MAIRSNRRRNKDRNYTYSDLHKGLEFDATGNIIEYFDYGVIDNAIKTYFGTIPGERVRSSYGSPLTSYLFRPMNEETVRAIRRVITRGLEDDEPRILVDEVEVIPDYENNSYEINILYVILGLSGQYTSTFKLRSFDPF